MLDYFFSNLVLIIILGCFLLLLSRICHIYAHLIKKDQLVQQQQKLLLKNSRKLHELERRIRLWQLDSKLKEQKRDPRTKEQRLKQAFFPHWPSDN